MRKILKFSFLLFIAALLPLSIATSNAPIEKHVLGNGIKLILKEEHSRPIVSLCLLVDGGSRIETPDVSGISHFIEHLVFRGPTAKFSELELRKQFRIWGDFSGFTNKDETCYGFTVRPDEFDISLDAFVDGVMNLTIPESCIEKERSVVCQEIHQRGDTPYVKIFDLFGRTALKVHPYKNPIIGYENIIKNLDSNVFRSYYHDHYTPDHIVISIVGDFKSDIIKNKIENAFSDYAKNGKNFEPTSIEPPQDSERSASDEADINSTYILMGWRIPPAKENATASLDVLANVLCGSEDSRLYRKLKIDSNLADEVYCFSDSSHDAGFLNVMAIAQPENAEKIRGIVLEEIANLVSNPPSVEELSRAKKRIENDFNFSQQTFWDQALFLATWEIYDNLDLGYNWLKTIDAVTSNDIKTSASDYLKPEKLTYVSLVPRKVEETAPKPADVPFQKDVSRLNLDDKGYGSIVLANGIKIIFKKDTASNIVGISVLAGDGLIAEPSGKEGINNFISQILLKGAGGMDRTALDKKIEELGVNVSSTANADFIDISMEIEKSRFRDGLELLGKIIFEPSFDNDEIERLRKEILARISRKEDMSFPLVNEKFMKSVYGDTPYAHPIDGFTETVELISRDDLVGSHSIAFAPKNIVIAIVGDVDPGNLSWTANRFLGGIQSSGILAEKMDYKYPMENIPSAESGEEIMNLPRTQVSFNMGSIGLGASDPDFPALKMLVHLLSLRVFDKYVYDLGWAYRMWFYMPTRKWSSPVMFEMGVEQKNFDEAKKGLLDSMTEITSKPVPKEEFDKTVKYILQSFHLAMQKSADIAHYLAFYEKMGLGYEFVEDYDKIYSSLTPADISRAARKYLHPDKLKLVAIIPKMETEKETN